MGDSSMITPVDFDAVFANNSALSLGSAFLQHAGPEPEGDSPLPQLTSGRSTGSSLGGSRPNSRDRLRPLSRTPSLLQTPESSQGTVYRNTPDQPKAQRTVATGQFADAKRARAGEMQDGALPAAMTTASVSQPSSHGGSQLFGAHGRPSSRERTAPQARPSGSMGGRRGGEGRRSRTSGSIRPPASRES